MRSNCVWLVLGALMGSLLLSLCCGASLLPLADLLDSTGVNSRIIWELRFPRWLVTVLTGAILAVLGASYQSLFRNPLAEPYVLGVSNAVLLGLAVAEIILGWAAASLGTYAVAASFAVGVLVFLLWLSHKGFRNQSDRLLLFGMALQFALSSALFLLISYQAQKVGGSSLRWFFGQLPWATLQQFFWYAGLTLPVVFLLWALAPWFDLLSLGDATALSLGIRPRRARTALLLLTGYLTAVAVCFAGTIGFVGLVVPHATQLLFQVGSTRRLFFLSGLCGALFLSFSDLLSRIVLPPFEFPVGIITTVVGGPLFLVLLTRRLLR